MIEIKEYVGSIPKQISIPETDEKVNVSKDIEVNVNLEEEYKGLDIKEVVVQTQDNQL